MLSELESTLPHHPSEISTRWLGLCLRHFNGFETAAVANIEVSVNARWNLADTARLRVAYEHGASAELPKQLFVKVAEHDDPLGGIFPGEFNFYNETPTEKLPLAICYGAVREPNSPRSVIVLEDLNPTHSQPTWPTQPSIEMLSEAVTSLSGLHAHWWTGSDSAKTSLEPTLRANEQGLARFFQPLVEKFLESLSTQLSEQQRDSVRAACSEFPRLKQQRAESDLPVTRTHGDPHFWNVLYPDDSAAHGCVFIDWEDWRVDMAAADLAAMLVLHWDCAERRAHECELLRTYHDSLLGASVERYDSQQLFADYRLGCLQNIVVPLFQHHTGISADTWQPMLHRWLAAFDDLGGAELL